MGIQPMTMNLLQLRPMASYIVGQVETGARCTSPAQRWELDNTDDVKVHATISQHNGAVTFYITAGLVVHIARSAWDAITILEVVLRKIAVADPSRLNGRLDGWPIV